MTPGLSELLEYKLAAERLHEHPFAVLTWHQQVPAHTKLVVYVKHKPHTFTGTNYEETHDKAVRAFMVYCRLDRIRGEDGDKTAWW